MEELRRAGQECLLPPLVADDEASLAVGALAVDPTRRGVLYAGTGEANVALRRQMVLSARPTSGDRGAGILKSVDGGESWRLLGRAQFSGAAFAALAVNPHRPQTLLAATTAGLFRSEDQAETWSRLREGLPLENAESMATSVAFHPRRASVAYAAFWGRGVFRSTDFCVSGGIADISSLTGISRR